MPLWLIVVLVLIGVIGALVGLTFFFMWLAKYLMEKIGKMINKE